MTITVTIERMAYLPEGTFGKMHLPSGKTLYTCERPWLQNAKQKSCIPMGVYDMKLRLSPVVQRSTGGEFGEGWEVLRVPARSYIMIHPANWPHELQGCISVGTTLGVLSGEYGVGNSRAAFREFMEEMQGKDWLLLIKQYRAE